MAQSGLVFQIDVMSGRFIPAGDSGGSLGDGTCIVTGSAPDLHTACAALNAAGSVPMPLAGRWSVSYAALATAVQGGARIALTPL